MRSLVLLAALLVPSLVSAQSHPLAGTWNIDVPVGMRIAGGEPEYITTKGVLTVTSTADSLIATLKLAPVEGRPERPATRLAAKNVSGKVSFTSVTTAQVNINGSETPQQATSVYVLEATGDKLVGTVTREIPNMANMGAQPITGTRATP